MKRFTEQFNKQANKVSLRASERADLRERLVTYMEYHPLPASMQTEKSVVAPGIVSQPFISLPINWFYMRSAATAFSVFLMIAVPVAAEYTKPGDVLYPVKIRFNEEVRSSLTLDPYEKIEWETERIERRIAEARLLAQEGELTDEREAEVVAAVKEHSGAAKAQIAALRETDADDAAIAEIAFATALEVQSEVLDKAVAVAEAGTAAEIGETVTAKGTVAGSVLAQAVAEETSAANASQAASTPSLPKLMAKVETDTTAAFELFASVKKHASVAEIDDIERRLEDISRKVGKVTASLQADAAEDMEEAGTQIATTTATTTENVVSDEELATSTATTSEEVLAAMSVVEEVEAATLTPAVPVLAEGESIAILRGVLADLKKLVTFMTDIDVRASVTVEELVPLTPTDEELGADVQANVARMEQFLTTYGASSYEGGATEKIESGIGMVQTIMTESKDALVAGSYALALQKSESGVAYVEDLERIIWQETTAKIEEEIEPPVEQSTTTDEQTEE